MADNLSAIDRDFLIRTIIGEAGNEPPLGQAAVANVVLNRVKAGYGPTARDVVLAPGQFEPWQTRAPELLNIPRNSRPYQTAAYILDQVMAGKVADPTSGATHFLNPDIVRQRRGGSLPNWAAKPVASIGSHSFYAPYGAVEANAGTAINRALKGDEAQPPGAMSFASEARPASGPSPTPQQPAPQPAKQGATDMAQDNLSDDYLTALITGGAKGNATAAAPGADDGLSDADLERLIVSGAKTAKAAPMPATDQRSYGSKLTAQIGSGMPIIGPLTDKAQAAARAAFEPAVNPLREMMGRPPVPMSGESFGDRYNANLGEITGQNKTFAAENPIASTAANMVGGTMALAPLGATSVGARALGMTGSLPARMFYGGIGGSSIGAADAALRGEDVGTGAAFGGVVGGAAPAVGQLVGAVGNRVLNKVLPSRTAGNKLMDAMGGQGAIPGVNAELATNPRLSLMDVDPNARLMAQGIATQPGEGRAILDAAANARRQSAGGTIQSAYDSALGPTPDVKALLDKMKQTARTNADKGFNEALDNSKPVNLSGVLSHIDDVLRPGVSKLSQNQTNIRLSPAQEAVARVQSMLTDGKNTLTDPWRLHSVQQQLRVEADTLAKSANGQDRLTANALRDVRSKINDAIDKATGGKFKPAQAQYADDMSIQDAFEKGRGIFNNSKADLENRPEYWRAAFNDASTAEKDAMKVGARVAIDQEISAARNANARGIAIPETNFNADKLRIVLGDKETDKLMKALADEHAIAQTNAALFAGSQTQPRAEAARATSVRDVHPIGLGGYALPAAAEFIGSSMGQPGAGIPVLAYSLGRNMVQRGARALDVARNAEMARILSASGPERDAAMNRLLEIAQGSPAARAQLSKGANLLLQGAGQGYASGRR